MKARRQLNESIFSSPQPGSSPVKGCRSGENGHGCCSPRLLAATVEPLVLYSPTTISTWKPHDLHLRMIERISHLHRPGVVPAITCRQFPRRKQKATKTKSTNPSPKATQGKDRKSRKKKKKKDKKKQTKK